MKYHFSEYVLFENALQPEKQHESLWENRLKAKKTGVVVSENIVWEETVWTGKSRPIAKTGQMPGDIIFGTTSIDTRLLHNTHSWVVVAKIP